MATLCSAVTSAVSSDFKRSSLADLESPLKLKLGIYIYVLPNGIDSALRCFTVLQDSSGDTIRRSWNVHEV